LDAEAQATDLGVAYGSAAAPAGSGAWVAVQDDPDLASSNPLHPADPVYEPTAVHADAVGQATEDNWAKV
jgi:hypothetical protein